MTAAPSAILVTIGPSMPGLMGATSRRLRTGAGNGVNGKNLMSGENTPDIAAE
jgi:hypothetical protein